MKWAAAMVLIVAAAAAQAQSAAELAEWPRTDFSRRSVDLGEILSGGPPKGRRLAALPDSGVHFAFAWLAFNPDSEIVRALP